MFGYSGTIAQNTATTGGAAFTLPPARSEGRSEGFSYCPGETTAALQLDQPLYWGASSSEAIRPPPGLAPTTGAKSTIPEPETENRSDAENAPHSSAASTADTEHVALGSARLGSDPKSLADSKSACAMGAIMAWCRSHSHNEGRPAPFFLVKAQQPRALIISILSFLWLLCEIQRRAVATV
eukprot:Skav216432  [mRNA]  locus=scaffold3139:398955:409051:+ [translate_table: standard]